MNILELIVQVVILLTAKVAPQEIMEFSNAAIILLSSSTVI